MKKDRPSRSAAELPLDFRPLTSERWHDLEALFGERGACGGCWCMWWRLERAKFQKQKGDANKRALKKLTDAGEAPGLIAYLGDQPIAWCALAPRDRYPRFERSRVLKPVDDQPVWSITCFFVAKPFRGKGIIGRLLGAAVAFAREHGARILEGYPIESRTGRMPDPFVYTGLASSFRKAGFVEVLRRSETRPIMRYAIK